MDTAFSLSDDGYDTGWQKTLKGLHPTIILYIVTPTDHQSTSGPYSTRCQNCTHIRKKLKNYLSLNFYVFNKNSNFIKDKST